MSLGLTNALAVFIALINRVFKKYLNMFLIMLIDDIWIYLRSEIEHVDHLKVVLQSSKGPSTFHKV